MLYSIQSFHKFFICVLFETRSNSSLCPCQLKKLRTVFFKTDLIQTFGFTAQSVPLPTMDYSIHPRSYTITTTQYVGDTCRTKENGQGTFVLNLRTGSFYCGYKYPFIAFLTPLLHSISPPLSSFRTLALPLLHR